MTHKRVDELHFEDRFLHGSSVYQRHQGEEPSDHKIRCDRLGLLTMNGYFIPASDPYTEDFQPDTDVQLVKVTIALI